MDIARWGCVLALAAACLLSGCTVRQVTVTGTMTQTTVLTERTTIGLTRMGQPTVGVVAVRSYAEPASPGTVVEVTLVNNCADAVTLLTAVLHLKELVIFDFDVSSAHPLLPGESTSKRVTLSGSLDLRSRYTLSVSGSLSTGALFNDRGLVEIQPRPVA